VGDIVVEEKSVYWAVRTAFLYKNRRNFKEMFGISYEVIVLGKLNVDEGAILTF
jgi:hypothetical protein